MDSTNQSYKLLKRVKDTKSFSIDNLHNYDLFIQLGDHDFQISVSDTDSNKLLLFEDYGLRNCKVASQKFSFLNEIYDQHHLLKAGFWNGVTIGFKSAKFSFVPQQIFDSTRLDTFLRPTSNVDDSEKIEYCVHQNQGLVNVFAVSTQLIDFFAGSYPSITKHLRHHSSLIIDGIRHELDKESSPRTFLNIDRFVIDIIAFDEENKLSFYNQFNIKSFEEVIKYTKIVVESSQTDINIHPLQVMGQIPERSKYSRLLNKYFPDFQFVKRSSLYSYDYLFDELPEHQYYEVLSN